MHSANKQSPTPSGHGVHVNACIPYDGERPFCNSSFLFIFLFFSFFFSPPPPSLSPLVLLRLFLEIRVSCISRLLTPRERERERESAPAAATRRSTTGRHERFRDQIPGRRFVVPRYYSHNFSEPRSRRGEITYKRGSTDFADVCVQWPSTCTRALFYHVHRARARTTVRTRDINHEERNRSVTGACQRNSGNSFVKQRGASCSTAGTLIRDMYYFPRKLIAVDITSRGLSGPFPRIIRILRYVTFTRITLLDSVESRTLCNSEELLIRV